jgi:hypothetical protein
MDAVPPLAVFVVVLSWAIAIGEADAAFAVGLVMVTLMRLAARGRR